ncbi:[Fe-Fe] hydrogenase large subunit C-terminal domain-containing protein [Spirochaeta isovalerica]|uniref:Iron only hydrogenase large subunit-like protein n=1 Tax=Spirochaeta isovalerica TaxID=150 RepID=A0A841REP3_9SPIO|nr:[Fe-Fe] hydrogenase large subunit C-terminal domain-containing protein [Spirochaeta isovalerica]MBB6482463.1 iron only hydrogenase large subunit-like protein [Spirochaeta isovalerica]
MSSSRQPVYTEKTKCRDCYKCVRYCPVKAIKVEENSARIIDDLCIYCGRCVEICPTHAKKVRNDVPEVKKLIRSGRKVVLSLAPSWTTGVFGSREELIAAFRGLGFCAVSETALGAELVSSWTSEQLEREPGLMISSACPTVNELFRKYYPQFIDSLSRAPSPLEAHALFLKRLMGERIAVVFAGPCIAKKLEADNRDSEIDFALTFDEMSGWLGERSLTAATPRSFETEDLDFYPCQAVSGSLYAMEGGMIRSLGDMSRSPDRTMVPLSGMTHIMEALDEMDGRDGMMLELLSCPGGCVNGSGFKNRGNQFAYRKKSLIHFEKALAGSISSSPVLEAAESMNLQLPLKSFIRASAHREASFTDELIEEALYELGKEKEEDRLDCGGCGYNSCRDFAVAYLKKMGEKPMCVTNMRKRAQKKVDMLLRTLPMGVVIVNRRHQIVECNKGFASLFADPETICDEEYAKRHSDLPLINFVDLTSCLTDILSGRKSIFEERLKINGKFLKITFFSIDKGHLAGVIIQDITTTSVKREDVIRKAEEVISKNLQNVQQIASLLGENAAETEIILRSLTDQFQFTAAEGNL